MDNGASSFRRFLDGDESAFDEIMKEYFRSLVFFICRYVRDVNIAEDIAIDAFSDLCVHRHRYNFKVSLKTYLFMIGRSRALDYLKRQKHAETVGFSDAVELASEDGEPADAVLQGERKKAVNLAVAKLPPEMATAVHLVYIEEMTYDEAAKVMKRSRKQVDNLLYRAKKELRSILGEEGRQLL